MGQQDNLQLYGTMELRKTLIKKTGKLSSMQRRYRLNRVYDTCIWNKPQIKYLVLDKYVLNVSSINSKQNDEEEKSTNEVCKVSGLKETSYAQNAIALNAM